MKLIDEWRAVLRKAWSMHLAYGAIVLGALNIANQLLPALQGFMSPLAFAIASFLVALSVPLARVLDQGNMKAPDA